MQAENEITELKQQVEDLIFRGGTAAEKLLKMQQQCDQAIAERDASHEKLTTLTKKMVETLSDLTEKEVELNEAYSELSRLQEDVSIVASQSLLPEALQAERARSSELEEQLKAALAICSSLDDDEKSVKIANEQLHRQLGACENRAWALEMDLQSANSKLDAVQAKLDSALANPSANSPESADSSDIDALRLELATAHRELGEHKDRIAELESLQTLTTPMEALSMSHAIEDPNPIAAPRPPLGGALGGLLGEIKGGAKLKKVETKEPDSVALKSTKARANNQGGSIAELCQMKAQQRAAKTGRIDDLLSKQKESMQSPSTNGNSELARALARRFEKA